MKLKYIRLKKKIQPQIYKYFNINILIMFLNDKNSYVLFQSTEKVRDFLVEKLKNAEIALKSAIGEINLLKKQSESDQEVTENFLYS